MNPKDRMIRDLGICADYQSGLIGKALADKWRVSEPTVLRVITSAGIARKSRAEIMAALHARKILTSEAVANEFDVAPSAILSPEDRRHPVARARSVAGWILRKHYKAPNQDVMDAVAMSHFNWSAIGKRIERQPGMKTRMANVMARLSVDEAGPAP